MVPPHTKLRMRILTSVVMFYMTLCNAADADADRSIFAIIAQYVNYNHHCGSKGYKITMMVVITSHHINFKSQDCWCIQTIESCHWKHNKIVTSPNSLNMVAAIKTVSADTEMIGASTLDNVSDCACLLLSKYFL